MKIYFSATITDNNVYKKIYSKIITLLRKDGHKVYEYGSHYLKPENLLQRSDEEVVDTYKELNKYLKNSDLYIADISFPSVGIGYEISQAISLRKPVLALLSDKAEYHPIATIEGNKSRYLTMKKYNDKNLHQVIQDFVDESKKKLDSKFILIIPSKIDNYLKWYNETQRKHKAQVVRDAVEIMMKKDSEYQEQLKSEGYE